MPELIPQSHVSTNHLSVEKDIEKSCDSLPPSKTSTWRIKIYKYRPFVVHFALTVLVSATCLRFLDGRTFNVNSRRPQYQEVNGSFSHVTSFTPLQSDITTAVSLAAAITRVAGGWWATGYIWRSAFVAMERGGISAKGLSQAISYRPPAPRHFTRKSNMVIIYITLFAAFAIDYFSAALTGSFIWEAADTRIPGRIPLAGITNRTGQSILFDFRPQVQAMAFAYAMVTWGMLQPDSLLYVTEPSTTFRRVIQGAQYIPVNSTLTEIIIPYFALDAFEWIRDPDQVLTDRQISLLTPRLDGYNPFITNGTFGLLPDFEWGIESGSVNLTMPTSQSRLFAFFIYSESYNAGGLIPSCPQNYTIEPGSQINLFTLVLPDTFQAIFCFAIADVSYTAGVMNCQNCRVISPSIVEAQGQFSLFGHSSVVDALGLTPFLGTQLLLSNNTSLLSYGTRKNFAIELTSQAYQAAWAALSDSTLMDRNPTTVQIALPTLRAKVIHWRVFLWVVLHLWVLALGLLFTYVQSYCDHPWVEDPTMAVFWLDTRAALRHTSDPWQPGTEVQEDGLLILKLDDAGQCSVQVKSSSGSRQHRYLDSASLQCRPPSSSTIPAAESGESVEMLAQTSIPTTLLTSSSDSTRTPENSGD